MSLFKDIFESIIKEKWEWEDIKNELKIYNIPFKEDTGIITIEADIESSPIPSKNQYFEIDGNVIKNLGMCNFNKKVQNRIRCLSTTNFWVDYQVKNNKIIIKISEFY